MPFTKIEEEQLRSLLRLNIDMHKRRVINASDAVDPGDYVTKRQISGDTSIATPAAGSVKDNLTSDDVPAHHTTHEVGGSDPLDLTNLTGVLATRQNPVVHHERHETGTITNLASTDGADAATLYTSPADELLVYGLYGLLEHPQDPMPHAGEHTLEGLDPIRLDELYEATDNTDLDSSTLRHGLLPKLDGTVTNFLNGTGAWSAPAGSGSSISNGLNSIKTSITSGAITTTSTTMVDLTGVTATLVTGANKCLVSFVCNTFNSAVAQSIQFDLLIDGVSQGGTAGLVVCAGSAGGVDNWPANFTFLTDTLTAGSHVFKIQWKVSGGTGTARSSSVVPTILSIVELTTTAGAGNLVLLSETILSADAASVSITGISSLYRHLKIIIRARTTEAVAASNIKLNLNNDTGANYDYESLVVSNVTAAAGTAAAQTFAGAGNFPGTSSARTTQIGMSEIDIPYYTDTTFEKIFSVRNYDITTNPGSANNYVVESAGLWRSTAAINRIDLTASSGNIKAGSIVCLYGISAVLGGSFNNLLNFTRTPPVDAGFSWVNQGTASVVDTSGLGIYLKAPAAASDNFRLRVKNNPFTKFTIIACFIANKPAADFSGVGMVWRQSSDGKIITFGFVHGATTGKEGIQIGKYTSVTTFSAEYTKIPITFGSAPFFMKISDDGTNRICSFSSDGTNYYAIHTVGRTDFLTADQIGFYANANNASFDTAVTLLSWQEIQIP